MNYSDTISTEIETSDTVEECTCDANLFYKKYKDQIDGLLAQHIADKRAYIEEQKKSMDAKGTSFLSTTKKIKKSSKSLKTELQIERISKATMEMRIRPSISTSRTLQKKHTKQEIRRLEAKPEIELKISELKAIVPIKSDEDVDIMDKDVSEHLDFYIMSLNEKLRLLFDDGDGEEEAYTERGYYIFDRFVDRSEASTPLKLSTISASGEEGEEYFSFHFPEYDEECMSESTRRALDYLKCHKIGELFRFLGAHLVSASPCNPIDFLINLMDNCLNYRMGYCEPPLLYLPKHIESLFNSMDPMETGLIELNQYHTGMMTLGIRDYNMFPETVNLNMVQKHVFLNEAFNQLRIQLNEMIRCSETPPTTVTTFTPFYSIIAGESVAQ